MDIADLFIPKRAILPLSIGIVHYKVRIKMEPHEVCKVFFEDLAISINLASIVHGNKTCQQLITDHAK